MKTFRRAIAATELLLIFPAVLFIAALFARSIQPLQYEPAHTAQRIVDWYAAQPHLGLWVLMGAFPIAVLALGCTTLVGTWKRDAHLRQSAAQLLSAVRTHLATLLVATATITAAAILAIVALHVIAG